MCQLQVRFFAHPVLLISLTPTHRRASMHAWIDLDIDVEVTATISLIVSIPLEPYMASRWKCADILSLGRPGGPQDLGAGRRLVPHKRRRGDEAICRSQCRIVFHYWSHRALRGPELWTDLFCTWNCHDRSQFPHYRGKLPEHGA